jgi:uncharacterized membrane protein
MKRFVAILFTLLCALPIFAQQPPDPVTVVATVLELSNDQITAWNAILHARETALQPIAQQAQAKQDAIGHALAADHPDPAIVGNAFIELRGLQMQVASVNAQSATQFDQLLTPDQQQRLDGLRNAAQVCPIVPALQATGLVGN